VTKGKNYEETKKMIDKALFSENTSELANILKGLKNDSEWLKSNEGVQKLIDTLEKSE
jgi:hypothetical protein